MTKTRKEIAEQVINKYLNEPIKNITQAYYDEFVKENAESSAQVGLKTIVIRREIGRCCDWCASLAGEYEYGEQPADFFRRHDYCKCIVLFKNMKGRYTDVWSKKEFESEKAARIERINELGNEKASEISRLKRIARSQDKLYIDTLAIHKKYKVEGTILPDKKTYLINGKRYELDGTQNLLDYSNDELETAKAIIKAIGGDIQMMPKINRPKEIRVADYFRNGKCRIDKKEPKGGGKNTIYNNLMSAKDQAEYVALEIRSCKLNKKEIYSKLEEAFWSSHLSFIKGVIVLENDEVINIFERV